MYPVTFLTSCLLIVFCYFGAAEPPPAHGYGPPAPVEFNSNEVSSHEQYNAPIDFGNYGSFSSGSPSGYSAPSGSYTKVSPSFAPHFGNGNSNGFPAFKGSKGGVSSSYISIIHGPGGAGSASKVRPVAAYVSGKNSGAPAASYNGPPAFGGPATFNEPKFGSSGYSSDEVGNFGGPAFTKGFGSQGNFEYTGANADYSKGYEGGASDEVGSYSSGGPSYATFTGSKASFSPPQFSSHSGSRGNAYSTANVNVGGTVSGHGNFHPPAFSGSFKPSGTKAYNRYSSPKGGYQTGSSTSSFGASPLVGSETGYNSRALKAGYSADNKDEYSGEDTNLFNGFGDGAGFKVQSSYSTG